MTAELPTFSECVIGYRSWKLADWVLSPLSFGHPWRPGVNVSTCRAGERSNIGLYLTTQDRPLKRHAAPDQDCTCGLHAYHEIPEQPISFDGSPIVVGAVAAWGDLQVHYNGFRAERAQIVALVEAPSLHEVAETYGVPLVPRALLASEAQRHGTPLPESLRPPKPPPVIEFTFSLNQITNQALPHIGGWSFRAHTSILWTPGDEAQKSPAEKLEKYRPKRHANRQGPPRPQRPPKRLGGPR